MNNIRQILSPLNARPASLPPALFKVWEAYGKPFLHNVAPGCWVFSAKLKPKDVYALIPFTRSRDGNQLAQRFSSIIIAEYAETFLSGTWIPNSDPLIYSVSGYGVQGNHRLFGFKLAGETNPELEVEFLVVFGVPDEAERRLGRCFGWSRSQRMGEHKRLVAIAVCGVGVRLNRQTLSGSKTPEVALWLEVFRPLIEKVVAWKNTSGSGRAAVQLACVEALVIDNALHGNTAKTELFIDVMTEKQIEGCPWASLQKSYLKTYSDGASVTAKARDYHSTVYNLKRYLMGIPCQKDAKGRQPDKESRDAVWGVATAKRDFSSHISDYIIARLLAVFADKPEVFDGVDSLFDFEIAEASRFLDAKDSQETTTD